MLKYCYAQSVPVNVFKAHFLHQLILRELLSTPRNVRSSPHVGAWLERCLNGYDSLELPFCHPFDDTVDSACCSSALLRALRVPLGVLFLAASDLVGLERVEDVWALVTGCAFWLNAIWDWRRGERAWSEFDYLIVRVGRVACCRGRCEPGLLIVVTMFEKGRSVDVHLNGWCIGGEKLSGPCEAPEMRAVVAYTFKSD